MLYIVALLIPPLAVALTGRIFVAIILFVIWLPAILFSGGLTHPLFILLAWVIIYQRGEDRRVDRLLRGGRRDN